MIKDLFDNERVTITLPKTSAILACSRLKCQAHDDQRRAERHLRDHGYVHWRASTNHAATVRALIDLCRALRIPANWNW